MSFPSMSGSADTRGHPMFRSVVMRWVWRAYVWRLTQAGRWLVWPTLGFLAYTSASLEFQTFIPLSYACAVWLVALFFGILFCPKGTLASFHSDRVCAGERLPIEVEFENRGKWFTRDAFVLPHRLPPGIEADPGDGAALPLLKIGERHRAKLSVLCSQRGEYNLRGFRIETDFPFGIFRSYRVFDQPRSLLVYPRFTPLTRIELAAGRRYQPGGVALLSILGDSVEFIGNREFREGDNVRDIDWRATARLNKPIVREYREEYLLRVAVILDTHVPRKAPLQRSDAFEQAVSVSAAIGDYLARQEYIVDLFAAGPNLYHLMAGRSLAYLDQILDILACVNASPTEPFELIEPELSENLSRISSIICVFIDWTQTRRDFVSKLTEQGVGVKVIVIVSGRCAIDPNGDPMVDTVLLLQDVARATEL
jgi:uncharacterized protein (DUF58 family)